MIHKPNGIRNLYSFPSERFYSFDNNLIQWDQLFP